MTCDDLYEDDRLIVMVTRFLWDSWDTIWRMVTRRLELKEGLVTWERDEFKRLVALGGPLTEVPEGEKADNDKKPQPETIERDDRQLFAISRLLLDVWGDYLQRVEWALGPGREMNELESRNVMRFQKLGALPSPKMIAYWRLLDEREKQKDGEDEEVVSK